MDGLGVLNGPVGGIELILIVTVRGPHLSHGAVVVDVRVWVVTEGVRIYEVVPEQIVVLIVIGHVLVVI